MIQYLHFASARQVSASYATLCHNAWHAHAWTLTVKQPLQPQEEQLLLSSHRKETREIHCTFWHQIKRSQALYQAAHATLIYYVNSPWFCGDILKPHFYLLTIKNTEDKEQADIA